MNGTEELIYRAAMEKQTQRIDLWARGDWREVQKEGDISRPMADSCRGLTETKFCNMLQ